MIRLIIFVALSFHTLVDATRFTFSRVDWKIYAETDSKHFALFGQVQDMHGTRIVSVDEKGQHYLTSKCETGWEGIEKLDETTLSRYNGIRKYYLVPRSFTWSHNISGDEKEFICDKIDEPGYETRVFASTYFPSKLARVLISHELITFVHYDGTVRMKTDNCLGPNESILIEGLKKVQIEAKKSFPLSSPEKALKKHLQRSPFDEGSFNLEQEYSKA